MKKEDIESLIKRTEYRLKKKYKTTEIRKAFNGNGEGIFYCMQEKNQFVVFYYANPHDLLRFYNKLKRELREQKINKK